MGWFSDRWFDIVDFFTTSDVEAQRNEYKKLVSYLNRKVPTLEEYVLLLEESYGKMFNTMNGQSDTSSGGLVDTYDSKFESYDQRTTALITYYKNQLAAMKEKQLDAEEQLAIYEQLVIEENRRKEEIARQEAEARAATMTTR